MQPRRRSWFWPAQACVALVGALALAAAGGPGCDNTSTLAVCSGQAGQPLTCTETGSDTGTETGTGVGACMSNLDCGGSPCCNFKCTELLHCPPDAGSDAHEDAPLDAAEG